MSGEIEYFSDRDRGPVSRVGEKIDHAAWGGIVATIRSRVSDGSLGIAFPDACPDGRGITGTDVEAFSLALGAEIPEISWPFDLENTPATLGILDLVEFTFRNVGKPTARNHHSFFGHDHFNYDREQGQLGFRQDINRILARNGLAYELQDDGRIVRLPLQCYERRSLLVHLLLVIARWIACWKMPERSFLILTQRFAERRWKNCGTPGNV